MAQVLIPRTGGRTTARPIAPECFRFIERCCRIDGTRRGDVRRGMSQIEAYNFVCRDTEIADSDETFAMEWHAGAQYEHVGTGHGAEGPIVQPEYPRHRDAIVESNGQLHPHLHLTATPDHQANEVGISVSRWHEVDDSRCRAIRRFDLGFEDERAGAISPRDLAAAVYWSDAPPS